MLDDVAADGSSAAVAAATAIAIDDWDFRQVFVCVLVHIHTYI